MPGGAHPQFAGGIDLDGSCPQDSWVNTGAKKRRPPAVAVLVLSLVVVALSTAGLLRVAAEGGDSTPAATPEWKLPPANAGFDYQIGGPYPPVEGAAVVVRDWHVKPASDHYDVCYINAFETQAEAETYWKTKHPDLLLQRDGSPVEDPGWPRQFLFDTSTAQKRAALASIMRPWIRSCAVKGFEAVEFDNLDSWYRSNDALTIDDNLAHARALVDMAHELHLAVAQKNGAVLKDLGKQTARFDFAIAESCEVFNECDSYTHAYGRRVFEIEYTDESGDPFARACAARGDQISVILRDRLVVPKGEEAYRYDAC